MQISGAPESRVSRIRPGESFTQFIKRLQDERAAKDPEYAARQKRLELEAKHALPEDHDWGGG